MKRLARILAELLAIGGLWLLWDGRVALTALLVLLVVHAVIDERRGRRAPDEPPTLTDRAGAAPAEPGPGGRPGAAAAPGGPARPAG